MSTSNLNHTLALISNITHQAINPLNGVLGTLDNLIDGTIEKDRREQRLKSARAQLEYTVSLIRNLAYFAQYGTEGTTDLKFRTTKTCVIPQTLIEAAQFFQEQGISANDVRINVLDRHLQNAVYGDPELLRQVFMNIFDNFVKYGEQNSTVEVKHWIQKKTGNLIVTMSGLSTPFSKDEDIFAVGVRGKSAELKTSSGSGLGLHICKLIIERLFKGSITAGYAHESRIATFDIRIPNAFTK